MSTSNIFSNVFIYGNCTVQGTFTSLGGSAVSQWTTSGSTIYYTTGNVGIGTATPGQLLSLANGNILLAGTWVPGTTYSVQGFNTDKRLEFNYSNGTVIYDNNAFLVRTGGSSGGIGTLGLYQNATGYVGIGTTNPGSLLTVSGGVGIGSGYNAFTAPTGGLIVQGNVGIGTTNPGVNALQVTGNVVTSGFTSNATNTVFNFDTLTVPFLNATQVGIGVTTPGYALDVVGKLRTSQLAMVGYTNIVNRRPFWGVGAWTGSNFNNFTTTTDTSYTLVYAYGPFAYGVPAVATGATRYFRIYAQWGDNLQQGNWYIDFIPQTSGSTITFTMPNTWGAPGTPRDGYSNSVADPSSNFNFHGTIYIRANTTNKVNGGGTLNPTQVQINYLELQAIDQY